MCVCVCVCLCEGVCEEGGVCVWVAVKMGGAQKCTTLNNYVRNCLMPFIQQEFSS